MQSKLAEVIREAIRASGQSAGRLGAVAGVDKAIITRFLRAERTITVETAEKLLGALGSVVAIKRDEGAKRSPQSEREKKRQGSPKKDGRRR